MQYILRFTHFPYSYARARTQSAHHLFFAVIGFLTLAGHEAWADSIGPMDAQTIVSSNSIGTVGWNTVNLSTTSDDKYATSWLAKNVQSNWLLHTNFNLNIPASTIDGIEAFVERKSSNSATN